MNRARFSPWPAVLLLGALAAYLSPQWGGPAVFPPQAANPHSTRTFPDRTAGPANVPVPSALTPQARRLFDSVRPASVQIEQLGSDGSGGLGSGFFISGGGLLLTAYHVVDGARVIRVRTVSDQVFNARVVGFDNAADVALLQIQTRGTVPFLPLAASSPS